MFLCILFFHMVIVKHVTPHLHEFMVKFLIFHVNQVNFDQEKYAVALIQHKRHSKNRLGAEMIVALWFCMWCVNTLIC